MYPEEFVDNDRKWKKRKIIEHKLELFFAFVSSLFVIGPVIHELGHVLIVILDGCLFDFNLGLSLLGLHGSIQPLCDMSTPVLLLFYSSGYLATIIVGGLLCFYSLNIRENDYLSYILGMFGVGILLSILLSIGDHGDVYLFLDVLGFSEGLGHLITLFVALGVSATSFRVLTVLFKQQEK